MNLEETGANKNISKSKGCVLVAFPTGEGRDGAQWLDGKHPKKIIFVKGKMVNVVM